MAFLTINHCCCISLPAAGIVIGVLGAVFSLLKSIECFAHLYHLKDMEEDGGYYDKLRTDIYYVLVPNVVYVITSILLIIGIRKNSHLMLLPWLITNVFALLLSVPIVLVYFYFAGIRVTAKDLLIIIAVICFVLGISLWIWISVYSLFQSIRHTRDEPSPENEKNLINLSPRYEIVQLDI